MTAPSPRCWPEQCDFAFLFYGSFSQRHKPCSFSLFENAAVAVLIVDVGCFKSRLRNHPVQSVCVG